MVLVGGGSLALAYTRAVQTTALALNSEHNVQQKRRSALFPQQVKYLFEETDLSSAPDLANRIWNCDETQGSCWASTGP